MWKHVFHLNTSVETGFSLHKRLKERGPALTSFPGRFPEKMEGVGTALLQYLYLYLTLSLCVVTSIGRLLGKIYVFLTPSKTDGIVPSQQVVPTTCNLTYWEVSQQRYLQPLLAGLGEATGQNSDLQWGVEGGIETWVWPKGEFIPSGGGEVSGKKLMPDILHIKSQQTPTVIFFQATLSIFGHITSSKLPSSKNWPEEHIFF